MWPGGLEERAVCACAARAATGEAIVQRYTNDRESPSGNNGLPIVERRSPGIPLDAVVTSAEKAKVTGANLLA